MENFWFDIQRFDGEEEDPETIYNTDNYAVISGTDGKDAIYNGYYDDEEYYGFVVGGSNVSISAGGGDDDIQNTGGSHALIDGGDGDDYIYNSSFWLYDEATENEYRIGSDYSTINGGDGDDYISNDGNNSTIDGGAGNDFIFNGEYYDEEIEEDVGVKNVTFVHSGGDDTIEGFNETSTLVLGSVSYYTETDGYDVIVYTGDGTVRLIGAAYLGVLNINGCEAADPENISNDEDNVVVAGTDDGESIDNLGNNVVINAQGGDDSIRNNWGDYSTINGGTGNDEITNNDGANVIIDGGQGNDAINNWGDRAKNSTLLGGDGDDAMYSDTTNVLLDGGQGNDSITNNNGYYSTVNGGEGDDYISNTASDNATIDGGEGSDIINSWDSNNVSINGGSGNDTIYNDHDQDNDQGKNVTIEGGAGNDLIGIFATYTTFVYNFGDGDDTIEGFNETSLLDLGGASYYKTRVGRDILVNVGDGSILLRGAASLSAINIDGEEVFHPVWTVKNTTATYGTADETLFTITGLKSGLTAEDDYIEGIYFDGDTIYLSADVLGSTNVSITGDGYYLALGEDVEEPEETDPEWNLLGNTAKLTISTTAGYTLSDDAQSITYTAERSSITLATITGLKRNLSEDDLSDGTYVDTDNKEITLTSDVLGTTNVSITGDYTLALGDDVYPPEEGDAEWKVSSGKTSTTATLSYMTSAGYELNEDDYKSITYTPAKSGEVIATITGLAKGLTVDDDGYIEGIDFDGDVITLSENVLGTTTVKITSDSGYTLAFGEDVPESTSEPEWKITSKASAATTTAVLGDKMTAGYTLNEDNDTITYTSDKTTTIATLTGLKKGLTIDELTAGIEYDTDSEQITLYADVLGTTKVTVKDSTKNTDYQLLLGDDVITEAEETDTWSVSGTTATFKRVESAYFSESTNGKTINYKAETKGTTLATIKGLASGLSKNDDGTIDGIEVDGETITLSADVLGNKKITLTGNDYALALGDDVELSEQAEAPEWNVSGTKAILNVTTSAGYVLSEDEKSITYNAKEKTAAVVTLTGIKAGLEPEDVDAAIEYDLDEKVITLSADVLGTSKITVKEKGYTLALDDDYEPTEVEDAWIISGTKATLSDGTSAGYELSDDERTIKYTAAKAGKAKATITGLKKGATEEDIDFDGETITLYDNALNKKKITLKGDYALALGDDVTDIAEQADDPEWKVSGTKATLNITTSAGYSCDGSTITYSTKATTTTVATISGLKKGTTADDLEFDGETTITMTADALGNKVSINGAGYEFAVDGDYNGTITGTKTADIITVNGVGATVNAGKGDDYLTTAGGNTFLYASGDGDDVIADFTEDDRIKVTSGTAEVATNGADVVVTVTKGKTVGTITLTDAAGQTISILDSKNKATTYETAAADSDSYWFIEDDFETTPQLTELTAEVNSMLGEMDFNDAMQLVQTTPIVTASDKK